MNITISEKEYDAICFAIGQIEASKDENIRKYLIHFVELNKEVNLPPDDADKIFAWLEKQGKQKSVKCVKDNALSDLLHKVVTRFINNPDYPYEERKEISERLIPYVEMLEKQGEQKPVEHLELKAGRWYICHRAYCCRADHLTVKEGEPKPTEWSQEDLICLGYLADFVDKNGDAFYGKNKPNVVKWIRSFAQLPQPQEEWSEEDEKKKEFLIGLVNEWCEKAPSATSMVKEEIVDWLKSLRPQKQWKPTERMLEALKWAKCEFHPDCPQTMEQLQYLYTELKTLYYDRT